MKNRIICILALSILFFTPAHVHAAFVVKRHTVVETSKVMSTTSTNNTIARHPRTSEAQDMLQQLSPQFFEDMMGRGWLGIFALLCGLVGFAYPIFSVGAIIFGFMGLGRRNRNRGLAIAGFVLGIAAVIMSI